MYEKVSYLSNSKFNFLNILVNWDGLTGWQAVMYRSS